MSVMYSVSHIVKHSGLLMRRTYLPATQGDLKSRSRQSKSGYTYFRSRMVMMAELDEILQLRGIQSHSVDLVNRGTDQGVWTDPSKPQIMRRFTEINRGRLYPKYQIQVQVNERSHQLMSWPTIHLH
jgi:hypothetical protein